jgi:hypothetical protein
MISSAKEFVELRTSKVPEHQRRAVYDSASEEVWFEVLSKFPEMTVWVICNKTVPLRVLRHLASHPDPHVRWTVATKRKLDDGLFDILSRDSDARVRERVAYNRKTPRHILERLVRDESEHVAEIAHRRLIELT